MKFLFVFTLVLLGLVKPSKQESSTDVADALVNEFETCLDLPNVTAILKCAVTTVGSEIKSCVNQTALADIALCLADIVDNSTESVVSTQSITNDPNTSFRQSKVYGCFEQVINCLNETVHVAYEAFLDALDPCVSETTSALIECANTNSAQCAEACQGSFTGETLNETASSGASDAAIVFATCRSIQNQVMPDICGPASCCPACIPQVEAVANCVVNNVIPDVATRAECDLTCETTGRRRGLTMVTRGLHEGEDHSMHTDVATYCSPNLFNFSNTNRTALDATGYLDCVYEHYYETLDSSSSSNNPSSGSMIPASKVVSSHIIGSAVAGALFGVANLWL